MPHAAFFTLKNPQFLMILRRLKSFPQRIVFPVQDMLPVNFIRRLRIA
jgi:hypothetical protein